MGDRQIVAGLATQLVAVAGEIMGSRNNCSGTRNAPGNPRWHLGAVPVAGVTSPDHRRDFTAGDG